MKKKIVSALLAATMVCGMSVVPAVGVAAADGTTAYVQHRSVKEVLYNLVCQTPDFTELRNSNVFQSGHFLSLESVFLLIYNQLVFQRFLCLNVQDLCIAQ